MTLEAFYAKIGGNSADVLRRLPSEAMVRKFIGKYPADTSWGSLESAINSQDWEVAFRAAHTLKGVAQNLGFQKLYLSSTALTEALRGPKPLTDPALREAVTDPVRRASCAAAVGARVREHFTWQSVAREVASVIDEAVAR